MDVPLLKIASGWVPKIPILSFLKSSLLWAKILNNIRQQLLKDKASKSGAFPWWLYRDNVLHSTF